MIVPTHRLTLPSLPTSTAEAVRFVEAMAELGRLPRAMADRLMLVAGEAVANAIEHGNQGEAEREVHLAWASDEHGGWLTVEDEGNGLDVRRFAEAELPENPMQTGGRGLYIMRLLTDGIEVDGSQVCFRFIRRPEENEGRTNEGEV